MKQLLTGLFIGLAIGLTCAACSVAKEYVKSEPMTMVFTERNFVNTMKVTTEEGVYRIFTIENRNNAAGGVGIAAVKIK